MDENINVLYSNVNSLNTKLCNHLKETVKKLIEQEISLNMLKKELASKENRHTSSNDDNRQNYLDEDVLIIEKNTISKMEQLPSSNSIMSQSP